MSQSNVSSIPAFSTISQILTNPEEAEAYLFLKGVIYPQPSCALCSGPTKRKKNLWLCIKKSCAKSISVFHGSFFEKTCLNCAQILHISYLWLSKVSSSSMTTITGHSKNTITNYIKYLNQLVSENMQEERSMIGGPNIIVEIDECKIAKRKYHQGHRVEGAWIVGGVERTQVRNLFVVRVEDRSADTLEHVIRQFVRSGSIVYTDCWKGYTCLKDMDVQHCTVNHSKYFRDPETQVHTNTIEGTWSGLKRTIPICNQSKNSVDDHLQLFIWRRQNALDLWGGLVRAMADTHFSSE